MCAGERAVAAQGLGTCILQTMADVMDPAPVGGWDRGEERGRSSFPAQGARCAHR